MEKENSVLSELASGIGKASSPRSEVAPDGRASGCLELSIFKAFDGLPHSAGDSRYDLYRGRREGTVCIGAYVSR